MMLNKYKVTCLAEVEVNAENQNAEKALAVRALTKVIDDGMDYIPDEYENIQEILGGEATDVVMIKNAENEI